MTAPADERVPARGARTPAVDPKRALSLARNVLDTEARAIAALAQRLAGPFVTAVELMLACRGRVVVSGIGKSGHVARKVAATLASTGTPAFFVHPAEASHGDLGMITSDDVVVMLSNSGETDELLMLAPHLKRQGARVIALTGNRESSLAQAADVHLDAAVDGEAGPLGLAPTASTTAALALGDALALALLDARGFSVEDFARSHPGGALGRRLLTRVADVMRTGAAIPRVHEDATLASAIVEMTGKGMGMTIVVGDDDRIAGIFTDRDLRDALAAGGDPRHTGVAAHMTRTPRTIEAGRLAADCVVLMETAPKVLQLVVVDDAGRLAGAVHMHDLFEARVI
ncbi:MAG: KpsF/GutQ family sugar-phosphate isomerase [Proteobacteria bacterium]|jgi:arabinose-5-phosphate isomerase|nr:KpsF/GutQ family sugar-phosphate isomerase [Pseudomonadota bacterium]